MIARFAVAAVIMAAGVIVPAGTAHAVETGATVTSIASSYSCTAQGKTNVCSTELTEWLSDGTTRTTNKVCIQRKARPVTCYTR